VHFFDLALGSVIWCPRRRKLLEFSHFTGIRIRSFFLADKRLIDFMIIDGILCCFFGV
jgi:hypothetical protein